jgi:O-antigen/teichoic acid export membrane protein
LAVGLGLIVNGICTYGFLVVAARALGPVEYEPLGVLWMAVFLAGPGFFLPLEQEVSRALADRRGRGVIGTGPVVKRAAVLGALLVAALVLTGLLLGSLMTATFFNGKWILVVTLVGTFFGFYATHLARGTFSGVVRFRPYSVLIGTDGLYRFLLCAALAVAGVGVAGPYGLILAVAPLLAVATAVLGQRNIITDGPDAPWSELSSSLGWLLVGSVLAQTLPNIPVLVADQLADEAQSGEVSQLQVGTVVSRVPLFLFLAVQAALLPKLSALASAGRIEEFKSGFRRLMVVVVAIGAIGTVAAFLIGPWVLSLFFGAEFDPGSRTLGLLAAGSALYMVALAMAQAVIALHGQVQQAAAWAAGLLGFTVTVVVTSILDYDLFLRAELGLLVGTGVAAAAMAAAVGQRIRSGAEADRTSLVEAIHDVPLEP